MLPPPKAAAASRKQGIADAFPEDDAKGSESDSSKVSGEEEMNICKIIHS